MEKGTPPGSSILSGAPLDESATRHSAPDRSPGASPPSAAPLQRCSSDSGSGWVVTYPKAPISNVTTAIAAKSATADSSEEECDDELSAYLSAESDEEDAGSSAARLKFKSGVHKPLKIVSPTVRRRARPSVTPQDVDLYALGSGKMTRRVDALVEAVRNFPRTAFDNFLIHSPLSA